MSSKQNTIEVVPTIGHEVTHRRGHSKWPTTKTEFLYIESLFLWTCLQNGCHRFHYNIEPYSTPSMVLNALVNCSIFGFAAVFPLNSSFHCPWTGSVGASQERMNTACHMLSVGKHISVWGTTAQPCSCRNAELSFYISCFTWEDVSENMFEVVPPFYESVVRACHYTMWGSRWGKSHKEQVLTGTFHFGFGLKYKEEWTRTVNRKMTVCTHCFTSVASK